MSKGTVRFPLDKPVPMRLVQQLAKVRAAEIRRPGQPLPPAMTDRRPATISFGEFVAHDGDDDGARRAARST